MDVQVESYKFDPATCDQPIQGYLLRLQEMPAFTDQRGERREWSAFMFKLTKPMRAKDVAGDMVSVDAGKVIALGASAGLRDLERYLVPDHVIELRVVPKELKNIGKGKRMRIWGVQANKSSIIRRELTEHGAPQQKLLTSGTSEAPF